MTRDEIAAQVAELRETAKRRLGPSLAYETPAHEQLALRRDVCSRAADALERLAPPAGWRLVPEEPTPEMLVNGSSMVRDFYSEKGLFPRTKAMWRAMLAAAPQPKGGAE